MTRLEQREGFSYSWIHVRSTSWTKMISSLFLQGSEAVSGHKVGPGMVLNLHT